MNFITFPVSTTNIFPIANSTAGGQLVTEFNLKARESVDTASIIKYMVGHSFVHSADDFAISKFEDAGVVTDSTKIVIAQGRGVINGHYVENLAPMVIDIAEANSLLKQDGKSPLKGRLCVGIRIMYSTEATMAGAMLKENENFMYEGVQVVILPVEQFVLPIDSPENQNNVTAHLKLGEIYYVNQEVSTVTNAYDEKCRYLPAERIANIDRLLSDIYIKKTNLNPGRLYIFAGKGTDDNGNDTWCPAEESLVIWDSDPKTIEESKLSEYSMTDTQLNRKSSNEAHFRASDDGHIQMYLPHKQVDGDRTNTSGDKVLWAPRVMNLPLADYNANTPGTVDKKYTNNIKKIKQELNQIYQLTGGKQIGYIDVLTDRNNLPVINTNATVGDYILVGQDQTLADYPVVDGIRNPSTMYAIIPGKVTKIAYVTSTTNDTKVPTALKGISLDTMELTAEDEAPNTKDADIYNAAWGIDSSNYRGIVNDDYFVALVKTDNDTITRYYYKVSVAESNQYSSPLLVTGMIPLATEDQVGGFFNAPDNALDGGYIRLDENGYLRLVDYSILRSGALAYQLGENIEVPEGLDSAGVQTVLDEYVNDRVAFANQNHNQWILDTIQESKGARTSYDSELHPNVINLYLNLPKDEEATEANPTNIYIQNLDSRFNTAVYLHIIGEATENTHIYIRNCEKIRIDSVIGGNPTIHLEDSSLYYDSFILGRLNYIKGLKLWYMQYEESDPKLVVDNMTVMEIDAAPVQQELDYWNANDKNDNHYVYALRNLTFADDGSIIGLGLYVKNNSTANISDTPVVYTSKFSIPQGSGLTYPISRVTKQLKVTGSFVSAYPTTDDNGTSGYRILDTKFTALANPYDPYKDKDASNGVIAFYATPTFVPIVEGLSPDTVIDCWSTDAYHIFEGGVIA